MGEELGKGWGHGKGREWGLTEGLLGGSQMELKAFMKLMKKEPKRPYHCTRVQLTEELAYAYGEHETQHLPGACGGSWWGALAESAGDY